MTRLYGYALKGKRINDYTPDVRFQRTSVVSTISLDGSQAPFVFQGTLNGDVFTTYVEKVLVPTLRKGKTLIMDNLRAHKVERALRQILDKGVNILFLPTYSPDLNPIEMSWSKMKASLRKAKARTYDDLVESIKHALNDIRSSDVSGWLKHCNYHIHH